MNRSHQEKETLLGNDKTTSKTRIAGPAGKCGSNGLLIDCTGDLLREMARNFYLFFYLKTLL